MIPDDLPEGLTLDELRHIWGQAEAADLDALYDEDDRIRAWRRAKDDDLGLE